MKASCIIDKVPYSLRHLGAHHQDRSEQTGTAHGAWLKANGKREAYGDYIEGLEEDFWLILEYIGRDFVQPKAKASNLFIEQQYGDSLAIPHYPQANFPPKRKAPTFTKTFQVKVLVKVGAIKKDVNRHRKMTHHRRPILTHPSG